MITTANNTRIPSDDIRRVQETRCALDCCGCRWRDCAGDGNPIRPRLEIFRSPEQADQLFAKQSIEEEIAEEVDRVVELLEDLSHLAADDERRIRCLRDGEAANGGDLVDGLDRRYQDDEADGENEKRDRCSSSCAVDGARPTSSILCRRRRGSGSRSYHSLNCARRFRFGTGCSCRQCFCQFSCSSSPLRYG